MSEKFKIKIKKVFLIVIFSVLAGAYFALVETVFNESTIPDGFYQHGPLFSFLAQTLAGLFGGFFFASLDIFFLRDHFRKKSFGKAILLETLIFVLLFLFITLIVNIAYLFVYTEHHIFSKEALERIIVYFKHPAFYLNFLNWMIVLIVVLMMLQISDKFGEGAFSNFFLGKYHKPKEEMRVFMFLDIKNSTRIAEQLGHTKYFSLLADFFSDATDPIIYNKGEIYQYVGDEITINWYLTKGIENTRCIKCFFDIKEKIAGRADHYLKEYGLVPDFKAGMHFGLVTVGEIGIVKKDIVYSGDLLNTTSRIVEECKNQQSDLLISGDLRDTFEADTLYNFNKLGQIELRGKEQKLDLVSVSL